MLMIRTRIGRYLYREIFMGVVLALVIIALVLGLVAFVELSRSVGKRADVGVFDLLWLSFLQTPGLVEETIPFTFLFGVMWTLFQLNRRSEFIAMRAAGLSAWRFLTPAIVIALFAGLSVSLFYNPFASRLTAAFEAQKHQLMDAKKSPVGAEREIWLREGNDEGQRVIHIRASNPGYNHFENVTIYSYSFDTRGGLTFSRRLDARTMSLKPGFWLLDHVAQTEPGQAPTEYNHMSLLTRLTPENVSQAVGQAQNRPSFWLLPDMIDEIRAAGFSPQKLVLKWYTLLAMPVTLLAMTLIAACVSLRFIRFGGVWGLFITGGSFGFLLYFTTEMLRALAMINILPAFLAVWSPPLFALLCGLAVLCFVEDG